MRIKAKARTALAITGVVALLIIAPLCIWLAQAAGDAARLSGAEARPLGAEELSPEAAALPLVTALWNKALYFEGSEYENQSYEHYKPYTDTSVPDRANQNMVKAGVLPPGGWPERYGGEESSMLELGLGFTQYDALTLWEGLAVLNGEWYPAGDDAFDLAAAAQNYVDYLGLESFGDWETGQIVDTPGMETAVLYSPGAQLMIQVVRDTRGGGLYYYCGVYPTTRASFAALSLPETENESTGGTP